ncbi:uncharacterized protein LOC117192573 [Drosophila miranda]|uniref:uncharacterized protein LOC117192573 n=1 Tax=Drosophila miranda TaxID=7229 RepID=UPI00143F9E98|nr:uncharacterized protein LOC117192573 [Drosophila miranda]
MGEPLTPRPSYDSSSDEGFTSPTMEADKHWESTCQASTDEKFLHDRRFGKAGGRPWVRHSVRELNRQLEAERATTGPYSDVSEDVDGPANCQKNTPANIAVDVAPWTTWKDADRTLQLLHAHPRPITPPGPEREIIPASDIDTTSDDEVQLLGEDDTTPLRIRDGSLGDALPRRLRNLGLQDEHEPPRHVTGNELPQLLQELGLGDGPVSPIPRDDGDEEVVWILGGQENQNGPIPDTCWDDGWHARLQEWDAQEEAAAPERRENPDWQPLDHAPMKWLSPDPTDHNAPNPEPTSCMAQEAEPGNASQPKEDSDLANRPSRLAGKHA